MIVQRYQVDTALPAIGDLDFGYETQAAFPVMNENVQFSMPIRVNTGDQLFGAFDVYVFYIFNIRRCTTIHN